MTLNLEALADIPKILAQQEEIAELLKGRAGRQLYPLKEACELKGVAYNTVKSNPEYMPRGGYPDMKMHGKRVWKRETIMEWCHVSDENRAEYLARQQR